MSTRKERIAERQRRIEERRQTKMIKAKTTKAEVLSFLWMIYLGIGLLGVLAIAAMTDFIIGGVMLFIWLFFAALWQNVIELANETTRLWRYIEKWQRNIEVGLDMVTTENDDEESFTEFLSGERE